MNTFASANYFMNKGQIWAFAPPSDNLWTISIRLHNDADSIEHDLSLSALMTNILTVNRKWSEIDNWAVNRYEIEGDHTLSNTLMSHLSEQPGIFLATDVNIESHSLATNDVIEGELQPQSGFLRYGTAIQNVIRHTPANIAFLANNFDIHDILFDRWIAAIGQQGLIESSDIRFPNIKADIYLYSYACSSPNKNGYELRKVVKLTKAFPISRGPIKFNYDVSDAGTFKSHVVGFKYESYSITYNRDFNIFYNMNDELKNNTTDYNSSIYNNPYSFNSNISYPDINDSIEVENFK